MSLGTDGSRPPFATVAVGVLAAIQLLAHLLVLPGYGLFRDELYYLACADHLDWGYVDHPAFSIVLLWVIKTLFGTSVWAVRLLPALAVTAVVVLVALTTRRLGGDRIAQTLAATATLIAPTYLGRGHIYSMNVLALLLWALVAWLLVRLLTADDAEHEGRLWWLLGLVLAVGLANKLDFLWLGAGLGVGLLFAERRRLKTRGPWIAGTVAMIGLAPYVLWQIAHDWPTREFVHNASTDKMVEVSLGDFLTGQIDAMHLFTVPVTLAGLIFLFLPAGRRFRLLGWAFLTVATILIVNGTSRAGYLTPAYTWIFPAGGVALEAVVTRWRQRWIAWVMVAVMLAGGVLVAPFALPILPIERFVAYAESLGATPSTEEKKELATLPQFYADMHGWRSIVDTVAEVVATLPADEQRVVRVFAPDYGIAGAIDYFGPDRGLQPALSGHNNYWLWPPTGDEIPVMIVIGGSRAGLGTLFDQVELARERLDCGYCMPYEDERPVWIARGPKQPIAEVWPTLKHFD
ncbi:MAG: glycosyltransferase family 39 protein [Acidobacteriota bacterium]